MKKALVGYGGHAREVMAQMGTKLTCFVDDDYVVEGTLYEYKLKNKLAKKGSCIDYSHDKIFKNMVIQDFEFNKIEKNNFIINDSGSCHISYTKDEGCILYSLWSGLHIKINELPVFFKNINK